MSQVSLKSSCGIFTKLRGTEKVIHYTKKFPQNTFLEMEAGEITQIRSLRFAFEQGKFKSIHLERPTFSLYLSGLVAEILRYLPPDTPIEQLGTRLSPELETLKFLLASGKLALQPGQIRCAIISDSLLSGWQALHQRLETKSYVDVATAIVRSDENVDWLKNLPGAPLVFINAFKTASILAQRLVTWLGTPDNRSSANFLIALRCSADKAKPVTNVLREEFDLPYYGEILENLVKAGWQLAYRFIPNLDRDYLLPFEGGYGVLILLVSSNTAVVAGVSSLQRFDANHAISKEIAIFDQNQATNYDLSLASDLPAMGEPVQPDWNLWCKSFDWNPGEVDWMKLSAT